MNQALTLRANETPHSDTHPLVPAALSMMLPGLGQVYNRELFKGIAVFFLAFLVIPYVYGILDAYFTAKRNQQRSRLSPAPATRALLAAPTGIPAQPTQTLDQQLLAEASRRGGDITVTEAVMATGRSFKEIEARLDAMCHAGYVDIDNREGSGVMVYRFSQLS